MNTQALDLIVNDVVPTKIDAWKGGSGSFLVHGATWGGGTVALQVLLPDQVTYVDVGPDTTLTADGGGNFELPPCRLKVRVATATGVSAKACTHH